MCGAKLWEVVGWTMLHYGWVGGIIGLLGLLTRRQLRSALPHIRYGAAIGCLVLLAMTPVVIVVVVAGSVYENPSSTAVGTRIGELVERGSAASRQIPGEAQPLGGASLGLSQPSVGSSRDGESTHLASDIRAPGSARNAAVGSTSPSNYEKIYRELRWAAMGMPWLWLCGSPLTFALTLAGLMGAERLRRQSRPIDDGAMDAAVRRLAASLEISRRIVVSISDRIASPILVGVLRPMILLPGVAIAGWTEEQLEMVLLHELAHVRRYDNLVNLCQRILESILFFHPMIWVISGWVRCEREHCCDALVVAHTRRPMIYANVLVALALAAAGSRKGQPFVSSPTVASVAERPLMHRIRQILHHEEPGVRISGRPIAGICLGVVAAAILLSGYVRATGSAGDQQTTDSLVAMKALEGKALAEAIGSCITENYARLGGVEATIETIYVDPTVKERQVHSGVTENGASFRFEKTPYMRTVSKVLLRDEELRSETIEPADSEILLFCKGRWTEAVPKSGYCQMRYPEQMPGRFPVDPREAASLDIGERFVDDLRRSNVLETQWTEDSSGRPWVELCLQRGNGRRQGQPYRCRFDPQRNFLPVAVEHLDTDGRCQLRIRIDYQEVTPKKAWFLREAVTTFPSQETRTVRTKGEVLIHQDFADEAMRAIGKTLRHEPCPTDESIHGIVVDEQGNPMSGVAIRSEQWAGVVGMTTSGKDGGFDLPVSGRPLAYCMTIVGGTSDRSRLGCSTWSLRDRHTSPHRLVVKPSRTVNVTVVDGNGKPVSDATVGVVCDACSIMTVPTDAEGKTQVFAPSDASSLSIVAFQHGVGFDYFGEDRHDVRLGEEATLPESIRLVLGGAKPLDVQLLDTAGNPVEGVSVRPCAICREGRGELRSFGMDVNVVTDAEGHARFDWLPADLTRVEFCAVNQDGYSYNEDIEFSVKDGGSRDRLVVKVKKPAKISGKVMTPDGKPASGIAIQAEGRHASCDYFRGYVRTDVNGEYSLFVSPNQTYLVAVVDEDWTAPSRMDLVLKEGEDRNQLDFQLGKGIVLHGTVTIGLDKRPLIDGSVAIVQIGRDVELPSEWTCNGRSCQLKDSTPVRCHAELCRWADTDTEGHYAFHVCPGEYRLRLPNEFGNAIRISVSDQKEIVQDGHSDSPPSSILRGMAVDSEGKPVADAELIYDGNRKVEVSKDGRFTIERRRDTVAFYARSENANLVGARVISCDDTEMTIEMRDAASATGRVIDAAGKPIGGALVYAGFRGGDGRTGTHYYFSQRVKTDQDGNYVIRGLFAGSNGEIELSRCEPEKNAYETSAGMKFEVRDGENRLRDVVFVHSPTVK